MLFPNHPRYAEMRAGMGYAGGSHSLLGYAAGSSHRGLGDFSPSMESLALSDGIAQSDIDLLNSLGATDQDIENLVNGLVTLPQLYAQYGVSIPSASAAAGNSSVATLPLAPTSTGASSVYSVPAQVPAGATLAQIPSGSTILYTATVVGGIGDLTLTPSSAQSQFAAALTQHGMSVVNSSNDESALNALFGTGAAIHFSFTILDTIGNAFVSDAKSVCDAVLTQLVGNNVQASNLSVISTPSVSAASGTAAGVPTMATDPLTWLQNNAIYIGGAVAALVLLNNFTGGKRR